MKYHTKIYHMIHLIEKQLLYQDLIYNALDFDIFSKMTNSADKNVILEMSNM